MFRFTIRDVLWLMVVAALAVGWWLDHRDSSNLSAARSHARELKENLESARWRYAPQTHKNPNYGNGESLPVDWSLLDKPIP
jgi:hypothetical protein